MRQLSTVTPNNPALPSRSPMPLRFSLRLALSLAVVSIALFLPALLRAQQDPLHTASRQELNIIKVLLAQENAWNKGDLAGYVNGFKDSPDTLFITHQIFRGFAGLLDQYKRDYPNRAAMGTLSFSDLEVHPLDENFAVVTGRYRLQRSKKEARNAETLLPLVLDNTT